MLTCAIICETVDHKSHVVSFPNSKFYQVGAVTIAYNNVYHRRGTSE